MKRWDAPVYAFFKPVPAIEYFDNRKAHIFECTATSCCQKTKYIRRLLYTGDTSSTSNLRRHAKVCWGEEAITAADRTGSAATARKALANKSGTNGSITAAFERVGKGKVTYSHRQYTKAESRYVVCINKQSLYLKFVMSVPSSCVGFLKANGHSRPLMIVDSVPL
jgi:hypothetical protein